MTIEEIIEKFVNMYARPKSELSSTSRLIRETAEMQRTQMTTDLHDLIENAIQEHDKIIDKVKAKMKYLTPEGGR